LRPGAVQKSGRILFSINGLNIFDNFGKVFDGGTMFALFTPQIQSTKLAKREVKSE